MRGENIATLLRSLAAGTIRLSDRLPDTVAAKHISRQLIRSATGGGANYEEARSAESRADFIHKVGVANKEVREALYWLQLLREAAIIEDPALEVVIRDANEVVAILTASIRTAKRNEASSSREAGDIGNRESELGIGDAPFQRT